MRLTPLNNRYLWQGSLSLLYPLGCLCSHNISTRIFRINAILMCVSFFFFSQLHPLWLHRRALHMNCCWKSQRFGFFMNPDKMIISLRYIWISWNLLGRICLGQKCHVQVVCIQSVALDQSRGAFLQVVFPITVSDPPGEAACGPWAKYVSFWREPCYLICPVLPGLVTHKVLHPASTLKSESLLMNSQPPSGLGSVCWRWMLSQLLSSSCSSHQWQVLIGQCISLSLPPAWMTSPMSSSNSCSSSEAQLQVFLLWRWMDESQFLCLQQTETQMEQA
jgi:hypothetical protein